jgi:hypothetical protein
MQTWKINGQIYTHQQLMELKAQGLDPRKDKIEMKFITKNNKDEIVGNVRKPQEEVIEDVTTEKTITQTPTNVETNIPEEEKDHFEAEEEEFKRLKKERAWKKADEKARYAELKAKFTE